MSTCTVVTGSAVGIGRAIAVRAAANDGVVFGIDLDARENETTRAEAGDTFTSFTGDVGDASFVSDVFAQIADQTKYIDVLVNNAALWNDASLTGGTYQQQTTAFRAAIDACLMGAFYCTSAALPLLRQAKAANIININTDHVKDGFLLTGMSPAAGYDAAKFGLHRLTEQWAAELRSEGIRVNELCFGATDTPMLRGVSEEMAKIAMQPSDLADAVYNVVSQGPQGDTGASYLFGLSRAPVETSRQEIAALANKTQ